MGGVGGVVFYLLAVRALSVGADDYTCEMCLQDGKYFKGTIKDRLNNECLDVCDTSDNNPMNVQYCIGTSDGKDPSLCNALVDPGLNTPNKLDLVVTATAWQLSVDKSCFLHNSSCADCLYGKLDGCAWGDRDGENAGCYLKNIPISPTDLSLWNADQECPDTECTTCAPRTGFSLIINSSGVASRCGDCTESFVPGKEWVVCVTTADECATTIKDPGVSEPSKLTVAPTSFVWKDSDSACFNASECESCAKRSGCKWVTSGTDNGCVPDGYPGADQFTEKTCGGDSKQTCQQCAAQDGFSMIITMDGVKTECGECTESHLPGKEWVVCVTDPKQCDTDIVNPGVEDDADLQEAPNAYEWKDDQQCFEIVECSKCRTHTGCKWAQSEGAVGCIRKDLDGAEGLAEGPQCSSGTCSECAALDGFSMTITKDGVSTDCGKCTGNWAPGGEWVVCVEDPKQCETDIVDPGVEDPTHLQEAPNAFNWKDDKQCFEITNCKQCKDNDQCEWRKYDTSHGCINKDVAHASATVEGSCTCEDCAKDRGFSMSITKENVTTDCDKCTESHLPGKEWVVCVEDPDQCDVKIVDPGVKDYSNLGILSPHKFDWKDDKQCFEFGSCWKCRAESGCRWVQSEVDTGCVKEGYPGSETMEDAGECTYENCSECSDAGLKLQAETTPEGFRVTCVTECEDSHMPNRWVECYDNCSDVKDPGVVDSAGLGNLNNIQPLKPRTCFAESNDCNTCVDLSDCWYAERTDDQGTEIGCINATWATDADFKSMTEIDCPTRSPGPAAKCRECQKSGKVLQMDIDVHGVTTNCVDPDVCFNRHRPGDWRHCFSTCVSIPDPGCAVDADWSAQPVPLGIDSCFRQDNCVDCRAVYGSLPEQTCIFALMEDDAAPGGKWSGCLHPAFMSFDDIFINETDCLEGDIPNSAYHPYSSNKGVLCVIVTIALLFDLSITFF